MIPTTPRSRNATHIFYGFKVKAGDIKQCLLKLTDLSGAFHSFSIRMVKNERPRNKLIIDIEMLEGFDPNKYDPQYYLYEFLSYMKRIQRNFREFVRVIPTEYFPELYFHPFCKVQFNESVYCTKSIYFF